MVDQKNTQGQGSQEAPAQNQSVTIRYDQLQAMYEDLVPHIRELAKIHQNPKVQKFLADSGKQHLQAIDFGSITGEICKDAPLVTKVIQFAETIAPWIATFIPGVGTGVAAALKVVDKLWTFVQASLLPQICPAPGH